MCIVFFAWQVDPHTPLLLAANRDEYYSRPTAPMDFWEGEPSMLAGRDLESGGAWLGLTKQGRLAFLTNVRDPSRTIDNPVTRGDLVKNWLQTDQDIDTYATKLRRDKDRYQGYNLVFGDTKRLAYYTNHSDVFQTIEPGYHGLSNGTLDEPWPKIRLGLEIFNLQNDENQLFQILADQTIAPDDTLPKTGVGEEIERALSPIFIKTPFYGSRCGTVVRSTVDGGQVVERTYRQDPHQFEERRFQI